MRTLAFVQARMGSTRLPGKVLADIEGEPMMARVVERAAAIPGVDEVVVCTTDLEQDEPLFELARARGWLTFRGSEDDVLGRFAGAARAHQADVIVRITSDCPLLDPEVIGRVVSAFRAGQPRVHYASNTMRRTFPRGLDTEVVRRDALESADAEDRDPALREHVTPYIQRSGRFALVEVVDAADHSDLRWTVDTPDDLRLVREVYRCLGSAASYPEVLALFARRPELATWNAHVAQKQV